MDSLRLRLALLCIATVSVVHGFTLSNVLPCHDGSAHTAASSFTRPRFAAAPVRVGSRFHSTLRCKEDAKDDDQFKQISDARGSSLDKAIQDDGVYEEKAMEAARIRVEELKAKAKNAPKPPPERPSNAVDSPSFIGQSLGNAAKDEALEQEAAAEVQEKRAEAFQGVEIDPRGFIVPQVGDIVLCPGKWANEDMVGLVENTQFVDQRMSWNIDVIELSSVGPSIYGRQYSAWKKPIKRWFDVSEVRPARAEYVEDQDAWRVENARDYINTPVLVNETARSLGLEEYGELKKKIITDTAVLGLGGSAALALLDPSVASSFAIGALASIAYIALLAQNVEEVGPDGAPSAGLPLLSPRFLAPLGLFAALYAKFTLIDHAELAPNGFPRIPPKEIAAAAIGFLVYKLPLLYESSRQVYLTMDDATEAVEKGVGEGYKQWQVRVKDNVREARVRESNPATSINPFTKIRLTVEEQYRQKEEQQRKEKEQSGEE